MRNAISIFTRSNAPLRRRKIPGFDRLPRLGDRSSPSRLLDELYTHDDVVATIDALRTILKSNVANELENFSHTSVLFLRQLLLQAEGQHVQLRIDTAKLDDELRPG